MARKPKLTDTQVIDLAEANPGSVLTDSALWGQFIAAVTVRANEFTGDTKTETARQRIASMAFKYVKYRTGIDGAGKDMTDEWRRQTDAVNKVRKTARESLQALQDKIKAPLTVWEEAQKQRDEMIQETLKRLRDHAGPLSRDDTPESVQEMLDWARGINDISPEVYGEWFDVAEAARIAAVDHLTREHARLVQEAKDREELAALRAEQARQEAERVAAVEREWQLQREAEIAAAAAEAERKAQAEALERAERERLTAVAEAERLARVREAERVQRHKSNIASLVAGAQYLQQASSIELGHRLSYLDSVSIEEFEEFAEEAKQTIETERGRIGTLIEAAKVREAAKAEEERKAQEARDALLIERERQRALREAGTPPAQVAVTRERQAEVHGEIVHGLMQMGFNEADAKLIVTHIVRKILPHLVVQY